MAMASLRNQITWAWFKRSWLDLTRGIRQNFPKNYQCSERKWGITAWEIFFKREYRGTMKVTIKFQPLRREFENMKTKEVETSKNYFSRLIEVVIQMKTNGENISNKYCWQNIISLPLLKKLEILLTFFFWEKEILLTWVLKNWWVQLKILSKVWVVSPNESAFQSKLNVSSKNYEKDPSSLVLTVDRYKGESSRGGRHERGRGSGRSNFERSGIMDPPQHPST